MELNEWLDNTPELFPKEFYNPPLYQNPIIGSDQPHTLDNVRDVLRFIQCVIVGSEDNELRLNASESSGIELIIHSCSHALEFETIYRPDGGEPIEDSIDAASPAPEDS